MINKRWITLPVVYSRRFTSKAVFWAILKEFDFAVDCPFYHVRNSRLSVDTFYRSFSLTRNKKINWKPYSGRSQAEMKCYKRLICPSLRSLWPSFWAICRNVSRTFEELCMAGRHIGIQFWWTNMAAGNQQTHLEFTFPITALSFHSRTRTCAHKHIF